VTGQGVQSIDYLAIAPPLLVALLALLVLVGDAFLPAVHRRVTGWAAVGGLAVAIALLVPLVGDRRETFCVPGDGLLLEACSYVVDDLTLVFQALVLAGAVVCVLLSLDTVRDSEPPSFIYMIKIKLKNSIPS
jgi:NADH-quinone oxidoreductase subunit N